MKRNRPARWVRLASAVAMAAMLAPMDSATATAAVAPRAAFPPPAAALPVCKGVDGYAAAFEGRRTFLWHPDALMRLKANRDTDPAIKSAYDNLITKAEAAMKRPLFTVVDKLTIPPSGDRHDYLSIVANYWPDATNPKGPYVRRDETNPDRYSNKYDVADMERMSADVEVLSLAYYFSGDTRYAARAANITRTWFITPASRMNPNMNYAQAVFGRELGRADGISETQRLQRVIESVGLLGPSGRWTPEDGQGLEKWFSDYVDWMRSSAFGKAAAATKGFQSLWYDAQLTHYALYARRPEVVKSVSDSFSKQRLAVQFAVDGTMPVELTRPRSLYYSVYSLSAAYSVAEIASCTGVDLWNADNGGRNMKKASTFIAGYADKPATWPFAESNPQQTDIDELMYRANRVWGAPFKAAPRVELVRYFKL